MPSGAKKRKAVKKKKEMEASHNPNSSAITHSHGDDDMKHHDGGEVSSPASKDRHSHQHKTGVEEEGVVQIDREVKPEDESESKNLRIEYVEPMSKSHQGGYSGSSSSSGSSDGGSSSSSSDDESHVVKKTSSVMETGSLVELAKPVEETYNSLVETAPVVNSGKVPVVEKVVQVHENAPIDNSITSDVVESGLKENWEKSLPSLVENSGISSIVMDFGSKEENTVVLTSNGNFATNLDAKVSEAQENEEKLLLSHNAPRVDASNDAEHIKESERPECSDNQPLVESVPLPVQSTSWKSCCGLFEVLIGSNR